MRIKLRNKTMHQGKFTRTLSGNIRLWRMPQASRCFNIVVICGAKHKVNILLFFLLTVFTYTANAANITKCKDKSGNTLYTAIPSDCADNMPVQVNLSIAKPSSIKGKVNYRYPQRNYVQEKGVWDIYVEKGMKDGDPDLYISSLEKLRNTLDYTFSMLPNKAKQKLSGLKVFLMWGNASPLGGRKSSMSYIRRGEPDNYSYLDKRWEHSVVIYSAKNLNYLSELWSRKAVFHELSHAWHISNWPDRHPAIYDTWRNAINNGMYTEVRDVKGKVIDSAYARKNQREYFAELSAIYFVGGNYYPFDKKGLGSYDPGGYKMIENLWN